MPRSFPFRAAFKRLAIFSVLLALPGLAFSQSPLKVGIFADADSLPLLVCEAENLFAEESIQVQLLRFQSAVERDSAFQSGAVDGVISDILAAILTSQAGFPVAITSLTDGRYGIALSPGSPLSTLADLKGRTIAISSNTVIHYMVELFLKEAGLKNSEMRLVPVPKMPVRLEMLLGGQVSAAGMPEPFLTTARTRGAKVLAATDDYGLGLGVLVFSKKTLASRSGDVAAMYRAYWKAANRINASPKHYISLLAEKLGFSREAAEAFAFVSYKKPRLPSEADLRSAAEWLKGKGLLKADISASELFDPRPIQGL
ncbi:MAG: nlpa lipoprotein [Spirochaetes bacterium]|nr:MAG: nlpa lipoprotein [Spirochaetota bacterium]